MSSRSGVLIELRAALFPRTYLRRRTSPITRDDLRIENYCAGLQSFGQVLSLLAHDPEVVFVENTVGSRRNLPRCVVDSLPHGVRLELSRSNLLGSLNKGAGEVASWRRLALGRLGTSAFVHVNARLRISDPRGMAKLVESKQDHLERANDFQLRTGYFKLPCISIDEFSRSCSLTRMAVLGLPLETLLFDYAVRRGLRITDSQAISERFSPESQAWLPY